GSARARRRPRTRWRRGPPGRRGPRQLLDARHDLRV
ncbi:MAG: hypothetical protein AVDCRST_MAG85-1668, partial [uncultured Solirubrobacteraceae bacterium]